MLIAFRPVLMVTLQLTMPRWQRSASRMPLCSPRCDPLPAPTFTKASWDLVLESLLLFPSHFLVAFQVASKHENSLSKKYEHFGRKPDFMCNCVDFVNTTHSLFLEWSWLGVLVIEKLHLCLFCLLYSIYTMIC